MKTVNFTKAFLTIAVLMACAAPQAMATQSPDENDATEQNAQATYQEQFSPCAIECINHVIIKRPENQNPQQLAACKKVIEALTENGCLGFITEWDNANHNLNIGNFPPISGYNMQGEVLNWHDKVCECIDKTAQAEYQKNKAN